MKSPSASVSASDREALAERGRRIMAMLPPGDVRDAWQAVVEDLEAGSVSDGASDALATIDAHIAMVQRMKN